MCIDYASRPRHSSRLTLRGQTFLKKPWVFDHYDSHIIRATHSGILTRVQSTRASAHATPQYTTLPYPCTYVQAQASVIYLAPLYFLRKITRPVSYYALFKCMAASKPTSWLFSRFHILSHLNVIRDLSCGSGLFPF